MRKRAGREETEISQIREGTLENEIRMDSERKKRQKRTAWGLPAHRGRTRNNAPVLSKSHQKLLRASCTKVRKPWCFLAAFTASRAPCRLNAIRHLVSAARAITA